MIRSVILLCAVLLMAACSEGSSNGTGQPSPSDGQTEQAAPPMPADFNFTIGSGGGVAGEWYSTRITPDGDLEDNGKKVATVPQSTRQRLWELLHEYDYFAMETRPGNMSTSIYVEANGEKKDVAREINTGDDTSEFHKLADDCQKLISGTRVPLNE